MQLPCRDEVVNVNLVKRKFDYVETLIPNVHFNERWPKEETSSGYDRIMYAYCADDNIVSYVATLQYFLLKGGLASWSPPQPPVPSVRWAIRRKRCDLMRTNLPKVQAEPVIFSKEEEGVLYYVPLEEEHGVFIFCSDAMTFPPRVEIRLKFSETPLCPEIWKRLIKRVIEKTIILA